MVDKINGNGVYDYPSHNNQRKSPAVQAYENTPGVKEASKRKSRNNAGHAHSEDKRGGQGVILDLSSKSGEHEAQQNEKSSWLDVLRRVFTPVFLWLKNFWESDSAAKADDGGFELPEELQPLLPLDEISDVPDYEPLIAEAVKSGSLAQVEQALTQNGEKRLAHNSDLLTYYDRKGKIVEIDETEKHRVLYGDKNILKL